MLYTKIIKLYFVATTLFFSNFTLNVNLIKNRNFRFLHKPDPSNTNYRYE